MPGSFLRGTFLSCSATDDLLHQKSRQMNRCGRIQSDLTFSIVLSFSVNDGHVCTLYYKLYCTCTPAD